MVRTSLRGINLSFLLLIIISTFSSCANEMNVFGGNNNQLLNFLVSVPQWKSRDSLATTKTSRAMPVGGTSLSTSNTFNLIADQNDGAGSYTTLIDKEPVSFRNSMWQTVKPHYWSGKSNSTVNFYAYYPSDINNISHTAGSSPTLSYTVPDDVTSQIDIIAATSNSVPGSTTSSTPLIFNHIFSAVKFCVGVSGLPSGTIKSISISGIHNSGTYTFGSGWSNVKGSNTFVISPSTVITGTSGVSITSDTYTLMMIPQIFSNATVSLVYNNGTTFSTTISGTWDAGGVYTYNLSKTIVFNYNYTGASQTFTAPYTGTYKFEAWGAGITTCNIGSYTSGLISLNIGQIIYVYVGQSGITGIITANPSWNGGGAVTSGFSDGNNFSGGGATDFRLVSGNWDDFSSLKSRIMVAGGGGGVVSAYDRLGFAGGLESIDSRHLFNEQEFIALKATQTSGNKFGIGASGDRTGGGGGYYGGNTTSQILNTTRTDHCASSGGSSFVSGYPGCDAIDKLSTSDNIIHTGLPNHYSGYVFNNSQMIAGNASMPSPSGGTEIGHTGNGYARITFISAN